MSRRRPDIRGQRRLGLRLSLAALALAATLALAAPDDRADGGLAVMAASGTLAHDNSRDGAAILSAAGVWPGWSDSGDVTITNSGTAGSWLRLTGADVQDNPGPGGGELSERLSLTVEDVTIPSFPVPVYTGSLGAVGERWLGRLEPSEARSYRFRTTMPSGTGDNAFQASAVSVRFEWAVSDVDPDSGPIDPPPDPPIDPPVDPPIDAPVDPPVNPPVDPVDPPRTPVDPPEEDPADENPQVVPDGPPVVEVDRADLKLQIAVPATQRPIRRRKLVVRAMCSRPCRATFRGKLTKPRRVARAGRRPARRVRRLPAGVRAKVKLRLRKKAVRKAWRTLRRGRPVAAKVRVVARDGAGTKARAVQRIRLVPVGG